MRNDGTWTQGTNQTKPRSRERVSSDLERPQSRERVSFNGGGGDGSERLRLRVGLREERDERVDGGKMMKKKDALDS